jgi:hypothetical protein
MTRKKEKRIRKMKINYPEERQRRLLERLGFVQLVFDFYTAPVM